MNIARVVLKSIVQFADDRRSTTVFSFGGRGRGRGRGRGEGLNT